MIFGLGLTWNHLGTGQWRLLLIKWECGTAVSWWACVTEVHSESSIYSASKTAILLSITLQLICGSISSPLIQNNSFLWALLLPPFICWPLLKGHMQLSGGHCLGNKGQLLSHDLTKGTAAVNRFYALLMFSRHLFLLTKCFFKLCYASALGFTTGSSQCFRALELELASLRKIFSRKKRKKLPSHQIPRITTYYENKCECKQCFKNMKMKYLVTKGSVLRFKGHQNTSHLPPRTSSAKPPGWLLPCPRSSWCARHTHNPWSVHTFAWESLTETWSAEHGHCDGVEKPQHEHPQGAALTVQNPYPAPLTHRSHSVLREHMFPLKWDLDGYFI